MKKILMGMIALMLIGSASFATDKNGTVKKAKAKTECKKTVCKKDTKECKPTPACKK